jgi:hypothetical protein
MKNIDEIQNIILEKKIMLSKMNHILDIASKYDGEVAKDIYGNVIGSNSRTGLIGYSGYSGYFNVANSIRESLGIHTEKN